MKISIIVPVYNVEKYLSKCIDSILMQSYKNIEILLINDGSTDKSKPICIDYENEYSYIRLINKDNGGLSDARNVGIINSTGDYIMFLDSDDYWDTDFLCDLLEYVKFDKPDYVFFRHKYFYQNANNFKENYLNCKREIIKGKSGPTCLEYILSNNKNFHWSACLGLIKRSFLIKNKILFKTGRNYEDVLWTPKVFLNAKTIDYYDKAVYVYRLERDGQITSNFSIKNLTDNIFVASYWYKKLSEYNLESKLKKLILNNISTRYYFSIWFSGYLNSSDKRALITTLKENVELFRYSNNFVCKLTMASCKIFGFEITSLIFKCFIRIKRYIIRFVYNYVRKT